MPNPPNVTSIAEFVYHQSQFMRDHFLLQPELLETSVRTIVPGLEQMDRAEIVAQFQAALLPLATQSETNDDTNTTTMQQTDDTETPATLRENAFSRVRNIPGDGAPIIPKKLTEKDELERARLSKRSKKESVRAREAKEAATGIVKRPQGRAPFGKTWDYVNGGWVDIHRGSVVTTQPVATKTTSKGQFPVPAGRRKKGCTWDRSTGRWIPKPLPSANAIPSPQASPVGEDRYQIQKEELKKDERGLYMQPQGQPPLNCYWDRKVGKWRDFPFATPQGS